MALLEIEGIDDLAAGSALAAADRFVSFPNGSAVGKRQTYTQLITLLGATFAALASPALTGTPTAPTAAPGTNSTQLATTAFVKAALDVMLGGVGPALDTLNELAAALGNDANFAATVTTALAGKQPVDADLTAIAALTTTSFGRAFLTLADAAAARATVVAPYGTRLLGVNGIRKGDTGLYLFGDGIESFTTGAITANRLYAVPFSVPIDHALTKVGFKVAATVTGNARAGIYKDNGSGSPGALVADGGQFDVGASTGNKEATIAATLVPGLHWLVFFADCAANINVVNTMRLYPLGFAADLSTGRRYLFRDTTYGSLLADESAQTYAASSSVMPAVWVRA